MSTKSIINEGYSIWRKNWLNEVITFGILAFVGLVFILPITLTIAYEGDSMGLNALVGLSLITSLILAVHISLVVAIIQVMDQYTQTDESITITETLIIVFSRIKDLIISSVFYLIIIGLPASLMYYYLIDYYLDEFLLRVFLVCLIGVVMIIFGTPWFVGIGFVMNDDMTALASIRRSWTRFYQKMNTILAPAFVAVAPVLLAGLGVVILALTMPSGSMLILWSILIILLLMFLGIILLPWSLNITYPLFTRMED